MRATMLPVCSSAEDRGTTRDSSSHKHTEARLQESALMLAVNYTWKLLQPPLPPHWSKCSRNRSEATVFSTAKVTQGHAVCTFWW